MVDVLIQKPKAKFHPAGNYGNFFNVLVAKNPAMQKLAYQLRYQVYCVENEFEDKSLYPDELEKDRFDSHAVQSLVLHRASQKALGTVRLILPQKDTAIGLPLWTLNPQACLFKNHGFPASRTAEISRFAVSSAAMESIRATHAGFTRGTLFRNVMMGLIIAIAQASLMHNVTHLCALMDPRLFKFIKTIGLPFEALGAPFAHRGMRQPCYAEAHKLGHALQTIHPALWEQVILTERSI